MSLPLSDSKAFWHLREGEQKDEGPTESYSLRPLRALGLGGMAFRLSGPVVPSVENGAHKAYCPFSLQCSWQWLSWWERRGLGEVEKKAREGSGGWCKNEGGGPTPGTDTMQWEPYLTHTSPPPACRARPGETGRHFCTQEGLGLRLRWASIAGCIQKEDHDPVGCQISLVTCKQP